MCVNTYGGMAPLIAMEVIFFIVDFKFFREEKLNEKIYAL
jgi:hypothetical protein